MKILLLSLLLLPFVVFAQESFTISGRIKSPGGTALPVVNIKLDNGEKITAIDGNGRFEFKNVKPGTHSIMLTAIGFDTIRSDVHINKNLELLFTLQESSQTLQNVEIISKSRAAQLSEKGMTISSLDVKKVADFSLGAEEVLKTATGVVVRQGGGLGSQLNVNLNGLTGEAVRIYYDDIPIQVYGYGIQLNNIPVDALQRIDVYKGVMPIDVGTDALGGGINLVPVEASQSQLRASYSIGSFGTHRLTFNGNKNWDDKTSFSISSFYNHSDNDYNMRNVPNLTENLDAQGNVLSVSEETIDAKRFHNKHTSSFVEASLSLRNRSWTDKLTLSTSHSYRFDEIQQGRFIINTAVGEAQTKVNGFTQRLDYRKKFFDETLSLRYYGIISNAFSKVTDSTKSIYNWKGQKLITQNPVGSEIFTVPTLREGRDLGTAHRLLMSFQIASNTTLKLSDFYSYSRIKGEDPVGRRLTIGGQQIDPNTIPSKISKNVFGAELEQRFFNQRLTSVAFYKNYSYSAESIDILSGSATLLPIRKVDDSQHGYGTALKFDVVPSVFIRGSYEKAVRIPTDFEVFGDFTTILPNYTLKPETSDNINAGVSFSSKFANGRYVSIKIDGFLRNQKNLIRLKQVGLENANYVNEAGVDGKGIEFTSKVTVFPNLDISGNVTYQSNVISAVGEDKADASIGLQLPNIPQFFYNIGAEYQIQKIFRSPNNLRLFWTYFFTDRFSINEVQNLDTANPTFVIPSQNLHNAGLTYSLVNHGLSFSFTIQNAFNTDIFDNFRIPRPGFNYAFKINYTLNNIK